MSHKYKTTLSIAETGVEIPIVIHYVRHKAYLSPGRTEPDEPAHCEVVSVIAAALFEIATPDWLVDPLNDDDELQRALLEDWAENDAADAEHRADARRDDAMLERFEREQRS